MYQPSKERYQSMTYVPSGNSGLKLPMVSLGFWHNFGDTASLANMKAMCCAAFDAGRQVSKCLELVFVGVLAVRDEEYDNMAVAQDICIVDHLSEKLLADIDVRTGCVVIGKRVDRIDSRLDIGGVIGERSYKVNVVIEIDKAELGTGHVLGDVFDISLDTVHTRIVTGIILGHHAERIIDADDAVAVELLSHDLDFI